MRGGRLLYFLVLALVFIAGIVAGWFGLPWDTSVVKTALGSVMMACGVFLFVPTLQAGDHFERKHPARFRAMAIAFILIGAGQALPNVVAGVVLQLAGIAALFVSMTRRVTASQ